MDREDLRGGADVAALWGSVAVLVVLAVAVLVWVATDSYRLHDPVRGLQQLDMLFLDEPAPLLDEVGVEPGRPTLLVVCRRCTPPPLEQVDAQVVVTDDEAVAAAYGLLSVEGRLGPGYAIVDSEGQVRYRTFDHRLGAHGEEIRILLEATP
jgi:hypothetical protein